MLEKILEPSIVNLNNKDQNYGVFKTSRCLPRDLSSDDTGAFVEGNFIKAAIILFKKLT